MPSPSGAVGLRDALPWWCLDYGVSGEDVGDAENSDDMEESSSSEGSNDDDDDDDEEYRVKGGSGSGKKRGKKHGKAVKGEGGVADAEVRLPMKVTALATAAVPSPCRGSHAASCMWCLSAFVVHPVSLLPRPSPPPPTHTTRPVHRRRAARTPRDALPTSAFVATAKGTLQPWSRQRMESRPKRAQLQAPMMVLMMVRWQGPAAVVVEGMPRPRRPWCTSVSWAPVDPSTTWTVCTATLRPTLRPISFASA